MKILLLFLLLTLSAAAHPLQSQIQQLVRQHNDWEIGVAITYLRDGKVIDQVEVNGDQSLALASVFKVPVLLELARQMESGQSGLRLNSQLKLSESEKCIGSGSLQRQPNGTPVTVERLIELMETISDNTATDMLFRRIGLASVNRFLKERGCRASDIALTNRAAWLISLGRSSDFKGLSPRQIASRWKKLSPSERLAAAERAEKENAATPLRTFQSWEDRSADKQSHAENVLVATTVDNLSSARDLATLMGDLYQGKVLKPEMTRYCLGVLGRQRFNTRIPRSLPSGTRVYHKTGTIAGVVNDIGVVEVKGKGAFAIAVLINQVGDGQEGQADRLIGKIARLAYDATP